MAEETPKIPSYLVMYLRQEIERRTAYRAELEKLEKPPEYNEVHYLRYEAQKNNLEGIIKKLTGDIIAIVRKHIPSIEIDQNDEVTISNILVVLPPLHEIKHVTQVSSRGQ